MVAHSLFILSLFFMSPLYSPLSLSLSLSPSLSLPLSLSLSISGLWQDVLLTTLGSTVAVRYPSVQSIIPTSTQADLFILCELVNFGGKAVEAVLHATIDDGVAITQQVQGRKKNRKKKKRKRRGKKG